MVQQYQNNLECKIILIGFMASGKTTLGKKLSSKLGVSFIDTDAEIELIYKKSISELFELFGEEGFRKIESDFLVNYDFPNSFVLSTGGGMPCFNNNIQVLKQIGNTFYLKRSAKELMHRLVNAKDKRPLVLNKSEDELLDYINETLNNRELFYEQADYTLERTEQTPDEILDLLKLKREV